MEVVMVSTTREGDSHSKDATKLMENEHEENTEMHVDEVIEGKLRSESISLTISKKRSTSISRGDSSSGSSDSNTEIRHKLSMQSEKSRSVNESLDENKNKNVEDNSSRIEDNERLEISKEVNDVGNDNNLAKTESVEEEENRINESDQQTELEDNKNESDVVAEKERTNENMESNVANVGDNKISCSERLHKKRESRYLSNADKLRWIAYIKEDQYVLMHKFNDLYFFSTRKRN